MRHLRGAAITLGVLGLLAAAPSVARAQVNDLAVRTSGTLLRPGDQLRVELIAIEQFATPFTAQVTYRWNEATTVRDEDGNERPSTRTATRTSPRTGVVNFLDRFQSLLLDDSFYVGTQAASRYEIEVTLYVNTTSRVLGRLRSVVYFKDFPDTPEAGTLVVRGVKRANSKDWVTLDGTFPAGARYSILVMDTRDLVAWLDAGVTVTGPHDLDVISTLLSKLQTRSVDLVIHDHVHGVSTTLAGFTMPPAL